MTPAKHYRKIEHYTFGAVTIDGARYGNDVVVYPDEIAGWWRLEGHLVQAVDIDSILARAPDVLVIGTGHNAMMQVSTQVRQVCDERGIRLEIHPTAKACKVFNRLAGEGAAVIAALHLTC